MRSARRRRGRSDAGGGACSRRGAGAERNVLGLGARLVAARHLALAQRQAPHCRKPAVCLRLPAPCAHACPRAAAPPVLLRMASSRGFVPLPLSPACARRRPAACAAAAPSQRRIRRHADDLRSVRHPAPATRPTPRTATRPTPRTATRPTPRTRARLTAGGGFAQGRAHGPAGALAAAAQPARSQPAVCRLVAPRRMSGEGAAIAAVCGWCVTVAAAISAMLRGLPSCFSPASCRTVRAPYKF
eukprot:SAG11_NODE_5192_length_1634_cov_1.570033_1_plen_244_part_00